jgi:5-formyltetrahydrofolate cyclo-ligase
LADQKHYLRKELARLRKSIPDKLKSKKSKIICDMLLSDKRLIEAKNILLYYPTLEEVDIRPVIEYCWEKGKNVYFPYIKVIGISKVDGTGDLQDFGFGFKEPSSQADELAKQIELAKQVDLAELKLDLVILPGIGFDKDGNRLGRGKGWYDKFIGMLEYRPFLIGVCFKEQIVKDIPYKNYDIRTDVLVDA